MSDRDLTLWLLSNAGPAIRYRTAVELLDPAPSPDEIARLSEELEHSPLVQTWLSNIGQPGSPGALHGSVPTCFENAAGKLTQLGCHCGMASFDERMAPFRTWLAEQAAHPGAWHGFYGTLVAAGLARGGYRDAAIRQVVDERLAALDDLSRRKDYELYIPQDTYPGYPQAFRDKQLVSPDISGTRVLRIPIIADILLLAAWYDELDATGRVQADTIVAYLLDPAYQRLPHGYGVVKGEGRHYYAHGWSVHLPGFFGLSEMGPAAATLLPRLELLARFPAARADGYLARALAHLESLRTERGTYDFPGEYRRDQPGYWVSGYLQGLEQNRRSRLAGELESTFWMLSIRRRAGILGQ